MQCNIDVLYMTISYCTSSFVMGQTHRSFESCRCYLHNHQLLQKQFWSSCPEVVFQFIQTSLFIGRAKGRARSLYFKLVKNELFRRAARSRNENIHLLFGRETRSGVVLPLQSIWIILTVWPDSRIKVAQFFKKFPQKEALSYFIQKVTLYKIAQKVSKSLGYFWPKISD